MLVARTRTFLVEQPADSADGELFRLNPAAGSPWQRVESENGPYYYNMLTEVGLFLSSLDTTRRL